MIRLRYRGEEQVIALPKPPATLHATVSALLSIPKPRLKLILKGRQYPEDRSAELVDAAAAGGLPVCVIGTPSTQQLDSWQQRLPALVHSGREALSSLPGRAWSLLQSVLTLVWLFFSTLFMKPATARQTAAAWDGGAAGAAAQADGINPRR